MPTVLLDTGVWCALCDAQDNARPREVVDELYDRIAAHAIVLPWPVVYETLRTRFVKKRLALLRFESELKSPRVDLLDDTPYRYNALTLSLDSSLRRGRPLSMVDCVIRLLIDDPAINIRSLVTFNVGDFADVCASRKIELWSQ